MTPRKYDYTPDEIEEITTQWKITQETSERQIRISNALVATLKEF